MRRRILVLVPVLLLLAFVGRPTGAEAHDIGITRVTLHEVGSGRYVVRAKIAASSTVARPRWPERFEVSEHPLDMTPDGTGTWFSWSADAKDGVNLLTTDTIRLPWAADGAFVTMIEGKQGGEDNARFFPSRPSAETVVEVGLLGGAAPPWTEVLPRYMRIGVEHILFGWDHLAFLIAIMLISSGRPLIRLVTGFTLGHSLTLVAAALGWVHVPAPPVEAAIALSIVLIAFGALSKNASLHGGFLVVTGFGLLHGLGFAGAISEVGIPQAELVLGLAGFNLGVEVGQLWFVFAATLVVRAIHGAFGAARLEVLRPALALALVGLGAYWTVTRVFDFVA